MSSSSIALIASRSTSHDFVDFKINLNSLVELLTVIHQLLVEQNAWPSDSDPYIALKLACAKAFTQPQNLSDETVLKIARQCVLRAASHAKSVKARKTAEIADVASSLFPEIDTSTQKCIINLVSSGEFIPEDIMNDVFEYVDVLLILSLRLVSSSVAADAADAAAVEQLYAVYQDSF